MSITLDLSPELEARLQTEATNRGLQAPDYLLRLVEALMQPETGTDATERERLSAIDELMGVGIGANFSTADLERERQQEREREEAQYQQQFGGQATREKRAA